MPIAGGIATRPERREEPDGEHRSPIRTNPAKVRSALGGSKPETRNKFELPKEEMIKTGQDHFEFSPPNFGHASDFELRTSSFQSRRGAVVNFNDAYATGVALPRQQRGVLAGPQRYRYARLQWVCWGETRGR